MERRQQQRRIRRGRRDADAHAVKPSHVLVIDPHEDTRTLYAMMFSDADCVIYSAPDGPAGLATAEHRLPDVILTELVVPELDGFEIVRRLQANPVTAHIPVVAVTARLHADALEAARVAGFARIVPKPVDPSDLLETVWQVLQATPPDRRVRRRLRRALFTLRKLGAHLAGRDAAKERLRRLIDHLQVAVLAFDETGRYVAVSPAVSDLTGYSRDHILARSIFEAPMAEPVTDLDARWHSFLSAQQCTATGRVRDAHGGDIDLQAAFVSVLPGLYAAAIAPKVPAADETGR